MARRTHLEDTVSSEPMAPTTSAPVVDFRDDDPAPTPAPAPLLLARKLQPKAPDKPATPTPTGAQAEPESKSVFTPPSTTTPAPANPTAALDAAVVAAGGTPGDASTAPDPQLDTEPAPAGVNYGARRKRLGRILVFAAIAILYLVFKGGLVPNSATQTASPSAPASEETTAVATWTLHATLGDAATHRAQTGTFEGFTAPDSAVAAGRDTIIVSRVVDGSCFYGGIVAGADAQVQADPSGQACAPEAVAAAAESIVSQEAVIIDGERVYAASVLDDAAGEAVRYASYSYGTNGPSLDGFAQAGYPGLQVLELAPDGSAARVQIPAAGECLHGIITLEGASPDRHFGPCT